MIYIQKKPAPHIVQQKLIEAERTQEWKDIPGTDTEALREFFDRQDKTEIRRALWKEQHGLCAYCMCKIKEENLVIEHWMPLSANKATGLQFQNLLGSCRGGAKLDHSCNGTLCCDTAKGNQALTLDPRNRNHMEGMQYDKTGRIFNGQHPEFQEQLDKILCLNGKPRKDGSYDDTYTQLRYRRSKAYESCSKEFATLHKQKKLTPTRLEARIQQLQETLHSDGPAISFIGVYLYRYQRKLEQLKKRKL